MTTLEDTNSKCKGNLCDEDDVPCNDKIWIGNPYILVQPDKLLQFFPYTTMTYNQKINAIVRLSLYIGVMLTLMRRNLSMLIIPVAVIVLSIIIHYGTEYIEEKEEFSQPECKLNPDSKIVYPTKENPFMNPSLPDLSEEPNRVAATEVYGDTEELDQEINKAFYNKLYKDVNDVFGEITAERNFYTVPNTKTIPDTICFAKWLYGGPDKHCKEGNGEDCYRTLNTQFKGPRSTGDRYGNVSIGGTGVKN